MSRINDALRLARQQQKGAPRPTELPLPVVHPAPAKARQSDFSLPLLLALAGVLLVAGGLIALALFRHSPAEVNARTELVSSSATPIEAKPAIPQSVALPAESKQPTVDPVTSEAAAAVPSPAPAVVPPPPPKPTLPVVQGIFYRAENPSAIVNGRTVRPGTVLGEFRVLAITADAVVIADTGQTNVLKLSLDDGH